MKKKFWNQSISDRIFDVFINAAVFLFSFMVLYILYFTVIASFSNPDLVASGQIILIPRGITWRGYQFILRDNRIWTGYYNTIRYTAFGTLIALFITVPAGYALSRKDMIGRGIIMKFLVVTMFFGGGLIPTYMVVKNLGLVDTPYVLMILGSFGTFNLIICRTFFATTVPLELQEAAEIDGCGIIRFFIFIVLPISKAIIAVMTLFYAVGHWNSFFTALIYITRAKLYPLQLILRDILIQGQIIVAEGIDMEEYEALRQQARTIRYGIIIVSSLPVLIMYPFVQKHFVKGVTIGSIKG